LGARGDALLCNGFAPENLWKRIHRCESSSSDFETSSAGCLRASQILVNRGPLIFCGSAIRCGMKKRQIRRRTTGRSRKPKASTRDILTEPPRGAKVPRKWALHFRRLIELHEHLLRERGALSSAAREELSPFSEHMADAGTDAYDRDWALRMLSSEQDAIYQIEQAMDRIRNGTYGVCELTGKKIPAARLNAIPWTRFSADAERQLEREGSAARTRLGRREKLPRQETANDVGDEQS
jgi:RNA polymerase-binding transcription factor DksA